MIPTGDFLAHVGDWTGISHAELLGLLRGSAAVSAGGSDELERLKTIADDPEAVRTPRVRRRSRPTCSRSCARSRATPAPRSTGYLDLVGYRPLDGFDISEPVHAGAARRAAPGDPDHDRGARPRRAPTCPSSPPQSARRCPRSTAPSSTSSSARRASCTACATSAACTATSGRRGSCAAPRWRPAVGSPRAARIADPVHMVDANIDEMCALVTRHRRPVGRRARRARRVPRHPRPARTRRRSSATRRSRRPTRRACRRASAASCAPPASRSTRCSAAPRPSTSTTCCAASPRARASTRARRA